MRRRWMCAAAVAVSCLVVASPRAQQPRRSSFGDPYDRLTERQRVLVDDWIERFRQATGQEVETRAFYDRFVRLSTKTTFDAVTHALMTTKLTDASGKSLGDAFDLVAQVETVNGKVEGAPGDHQFRMYVVLKEGAIDVLTRSREFTRGPDNTVYHRGYPMNFRQKGGVPSIQISIAKDGRRADIDVDYRSSTFPLSLVNGHLSSSNSDVRAGDNYSRHQARWSGFLNWWRSLFGVRLTSDQEYADRDAGLVLPTAPRAGAKNIDEMMTDFLTAWLVEGDAMAALGYVSERAYACLAEEEGVPVDRGVAPYALLARMKAAQESLGTRRSLDGLAVGVRLANPDLKVARHDRHAQFVLYSVPDDVASRFDCESRMKLGDPKQAARRYGNYWGATFLIKGPWGDGPPIALLWAKEGDYWKIVSWQAEPKTEADIELPASEAPSVEVVRIAQDESLAKAAKDFLESWMIRRDYDRAFAYLSPESYACYNLFLPPERQPAGSAEEAGRLVRQAMERWGTLVGERSTLTGLLDGVEPVHPAIRVMDHPDSGTFTLVGLPNAIADWVDCAKRMTNEPFPGDAPPEYGRANGVYFRVATMGGETPVFRTLWVKADGEWRITAYDIELP